MRGLNSTIGRTLRDVAQTLASRRRLRQRLRVSLFRNAIYLMVNNALTGAFGLVFWLVASRWFYGTEDIGLASAAISAMMLLSLLATLGLDYALVRFLPTSGSSANAVINSTLTIGGLASIVLALVFIAGIGLWSPALGFLRQDVVFLCAFVLFTTAWTLYTLQSRAFVARRRADLSLTQGIIFNVFRLGLVVLLALFFATFGIFASWGIAVVVALLVGALLFLPRVQPGYHPFPAVKREVIGDMVHFSFTNYIAQLLWFAPAYVLPIMVVNLAGAESNAYFYIAWAVANVLFQVPSSTSFAMIAESSYDEKELRQNTRRIVTLTLLIVFPAILAVALLADRLLLLFAPSYAENAANLLRVLAVSAAPLSLNFIYFAVKRVEMQMRGVVGLSALMVVATLALSWLLLPRMGVLGVGIAWLSSQGAVAIYTTCVLLRSPTTEKGRPA